MYMYSSNVYFLIENFIFHLPSSSQHHKYLHSQISFSPIGPDSTMTEATSMALEFANELYANEKIPVFTYGEASTTKLFLKDIRRELGYFLKVSSVNVAFLVVGC
jgi:Formiminotransferase domain, N-terminal subdomain